LRWSKIARNFTVSLPPFILVIEKKCQKVK
jgi:hypothetical protein